MGEYSWFKIFAAAMLVMCNAFFVVAEFALVKVRKTRLEELVYQGNQSAVLALKIVSGADMYVGATQLGITLSSLALGWLGQPAVAALLMPLMAKIFAGHVWLYSTVSTVVAFSLIVFMHIVIGELVPKSLAIQHAEKMVLFAAQPLYIFRKIGHPIIIVLNQSAKAILQLFGVSTATEADLAHSEEELRMFVSASHRGGVLNEMESELIDNVFDFADRLAREIMIPRQDMVCLFAEDSYEENVRVIKQTSHTRYPLCMEDKDHVIGMIHLRDFMDIESCETVEKDLGTIMREILVVPEGMSVAKLLQLMRRRRIHLAVVADEYGGTAGLVALEDIIEEIVGDIQDEHDSVHEIEVQRLNDGSYEFDGRVLLDDVVELLNIRLQEHDEDTIGGYIFGLLGRRPETGDVASIGDYNFTVLKVNGFRIVRVKAVPLSVSVETVE